MTAPLPLIRAGRARRKAQRLALRDHGFTNGRAEPVDFKKALRAIGGRFF